MLGYLVFFIDSYDNISKDSLKNSYFMSSLEDFYLFLQEQNVEFHYVFYFRPMNFSFLPSDDVYIFPVRCDSYGL